ncbi:hypothetical protein [Halomonas mongoliensis]|uniref:hypothetical protein n=1 Tax=Halomonas mongoliensis TaxID=321265 RepID=UPI00403A8E1A
MKVPLFSFFSMAILVLFFFIGWAFGENVRFSEQWPLFEALRNTAAIIFAVVGAWFAIIYPERMRGYLNPSAPLAISASEGIGKLFSPIVHSTIILCIILLLGVLAPLLKQIDFFVSHAETLRRVSFGLLYVLTFWQIWTVLVTLVPALLLKEASGQQKLNEDNLYSYRKNKVVKDADEDGGDDD